MQRTVPVLALVAMLLVTAAAPASTTRLPHEYVDRPLVTPDVTLRLDGGPRWPLPSGQLEWIVADPDFVRLQPGVTLGIVDRFEAGLVLPFLIEPDGDVGDPTLHTQFQFLRSDLDLSFAAALDLPVQGEFGLTLGVPAALHLGIVRLGSGLFFTRLFDDEGFVFPLEAAFQVTRSGLYLGPEFALGAELDDAGGAPYGGDGASVMLGFFLGHAIRAGGGTLGDVSGRIRLPDVGNNDFDAVWFLLALDFYFDL